MFSWAEYLALLHACSAHPFPRFSCLLVVQGPNQLVQRRVYLVLHHILKELSSKRLAADQRNFEQVRQGDQLPSSASCCRPLAVRLSPRLPAAGVWWH